MSACDTSSACCAHLYTQAYGVCLRGQLCLVTELLRGGDLYHALRNHPALMRWECLGRKVALDIALGINHLHCQSPPLMHRVRRGFQL